jgi:hypothetical protein
MVSLPELKNRWWYWFEIWHGDSAWETGGPCALLPTRECSQLTSGQKFLHKWRGKICFKIQHKSRNHRKSYIVNDLIIIFMSKKRYRNNQTHSISASKTQMNLFHIFFHFTKKPLCMTIKKSYSFFFVIHKVKS